MKDDLMSATRYAALSIRYAVAGSNSSNGYNITGDLPVRNWSSI